MKGLISVVICTYNRANLLEACLASFVNQTASKELYEVIIVDNNSKDNTSEIAKKFCAENSNFKFTFEKEQGLSKARNHGYKEAQFDWVAYIDDDARALPNYIERLIYDIQNFSFDCIGGPCIPMYHIDKPKWYKDEYQSAKKLSGVQELPGRLFVDGFNSVFRKSSLVQLNGFDTSIGMNGKKIAYGEETKMQVLLRKNNGKIWFDSDLIVHHYIDSYKLQLSWFIKSFYANGRDSWVTFQEGVSAKKLLGTAVRASLHIFKKFPVALKNLLLDKEYYFQNLIIDTFSIPAYNFGKMKAGFKIIFGNKN